MEGARHRYYIIDAFAPTDFCKASPGGMMNYHFFDVEEFGGSRLPANGPGTAAAQALSGHSFR